MILFLIFASHLSLAKQVISFEDFFTVDRLGAPVISNDTKKIAFTIKKADIKNNSYLTQIWIYGYESGKVTQITHDTLSSINPVFSFDNQFLYFLKGSSKSKQIWEFNLSTKELIKVSDVYGGIERFMLSPDNKHFIVERVVYPECSDEACQEELVNKKNRSKVKARIIDQLFYRHWDEWLEGKRNHLFLFNSGTKEIQDITPGDFDTPPIALESEHDYCFSPDGQEVCFVSNHDEPIATSTNNDLFIFSLDEKKTSRISTGSGCDIDPHYSPDGKYIAYRSMEQPGFESDRLRLLLFNRKSKETKELTKNFNLSVSEIVWSTLSDAILFTAEDAGNMTLFKVSLADCRIETLLKGHYIEGLSCMNSDHIICTDQSICKPAELASFNLQKNELSILTHFNDEQLKQFDLPDYEQFWFIGARGDSVHGFILKPPNFQQNKKYPAIHLIHGGPQNMWSNSYHYRWNYQMFAAAGAAVYWINFHGSSGYGQKFIDSITLHWGDLPYEDLIKGTQYVLENYDYIDPENLAAAGGSYGGYMISWIAGHENPYKCLICHAGVYDLISEYGATEELWFPEWDLGGTPWQGGNCYSKWSPSQLAVKFSTPTLVIHGELDFRVPYTQGLQFFTALQRRGVPSRLLIYPDEGHWINKPQNAQLWWETIYDWLHTYWQN
jgi:dipeptidyl aminopeptidase/acylaminoacyl peptidase